MRKHIIAILILLAGCDSTRRDWTYCSSTYSDCQEGYACNFATGMCEQTTDAGQPDAPSIVSEAGPPVDATPDDALAGDTADASILDVASLDTVTVLDGQPADVPITTDVGGFDTAVPDAPGTCLVDNDCPGTLLPYCVGGKCVECKNSSHCSNIAGTPFCSAQNTCVSCAMATAGFCSDSTPVCDGISGRCVECIYNDDCTTAAKSFCVANSCQGCNVSGASAANVRGSTDGGVASDGGGPVDAGVVGPCLGAKPVCATSGSMIGQCVECMTGAHCSGTTPICSSNICAACSTDSECAALGTGPGICMYHQDGRCASEAETLYVKKSAGCTGGSGTANSPYCDPQSAIAAVTSSQRVILVKGPAADVLAPIASTPSGGQVSVISKDGATLNGGGAVGIHVTAGDVFIRGVTVANGSDRGIVVESGATLRLERCLVKSNAGGGLLVQAGANFDIANSVFDGNGPGAVGPVRFGGVYLAGSAPSSGPSRFWFSTVIDNEEVGVVCAESTQRLTGMLLYNNVAGGFLNCLLEIKTQGSVSYGADSKWDSPGTGSDINDPRFSSSNPYHLTVSSKCKDFVDASLAHPSYDLDGDARPYPANGKLDCGADEYRP
ncbi:MAG: right-handed parallel beta-helix repeat-containing protein [Deltaproteobacteria bacterium]|nr:right-handed parallel beta-helix repeat-containing protein [Deltaproteobacteria bacterium]